jgi:hypothetical protein
MPIVRQISTNEPTSLSVDHLMRHTASARPAHQRSHQCGQPKTALAFPPDRRPERCVNERACGNRVAPTVRTRTRGSLTGHPGATHLFQVFLPACALRYISSLGQHLTIDTSVEAEELVTATSNGEGDRRRTAVVVSNLRTLRSEHDGSRNIRAPRISGNDG